MVGQKRVPSREGGVEVVVSELSRRLVERGNEVVAYCRRGHNVAGTQFDQHSVMEYEGVRVRHVRTIEARGLAAASSSYFATRAALADGVDVIHFHAEGPAAMVGLAKRAGVRSVVTIHGLDWQRAKWGRAASAYLRHGERRAAHEADEVIVLSRGAQEYFRRAYGRKTILIPNAVSVKSPVTARLIGSAWGLEPGSYVLFLGRIVPEKGLDHLIGAWGRVHTDKRLVIAGGASDSQGYLDHVRQRAAGDDSILFTDFVQGRVLEELYSNAYLYVLPSDLEGMPMSLLEAMSYGRCCLTSDIPECADVLAGTGTTFARGSASSLAEQLSSLLGAQQEVARQGRAALAHVRSTYSWDALVDRTLAVYEGTALPGPTR